MSGSSESKKQARAERQAQKEAEQRAAKRKDRIQMLLGGLVLVIAIFGVVLAVSGGGNDNASDKIETGDVTITGDALPPMPDSGQDAAVGQPAPTVAGTNFDGDSVTIPVDGEATLVTFLAHWCPHCNREVPVIVNEYAPDKLPAGVALVGVPTSTSPDQPNYPPSQWLAARNWTFPVLVDSEQDEAAKAYGVRAFPTFVVIGQDGNVLARTSGELSVDQLNQLVDAAAASVAS